ncbi:hypothetical protein RRG08_016105 [Elysia crispata]|uniref:Uncharacterized protein n=1 Tax=Elysia crispata TaxID=231223 RepID=A0AAE1DJ66_9GAST|nr:hypothetical protein RRG08_016105 [Elysia crispata]
MSELKGPKLYQRTREVWPAGELPVENRGGTISEINLNIEEEKLGERQEKTNPLRHGQLLCVCVERSFRYGHLGRAPVATP